MIRRAADYLAMTCIVVPIALCVWLFTAVVAI